jgi:hypothetical protein
MNEETRTKLAAKPARTQRPYTILGVLPDGSLMRLEEYDTRQKAVQAVKAHLAANPDASICFGRIHGPVTSKTETRTRVVGL